MSRSPCPSSNSVLPQPRSGRAANMDWLADLRCARLHVPPAQATSAALMAAGRLRRVLTAQASLAAACAGGRVLSYCRSKPFRSELQVTACRSCVLGWSTGTSAARAARHPARHATRERCARAPTCTPTHPPAAPPAAGGPRRCFCGLTRAGRRFASPPRALSGRCGLRSNLWHVVVGARAAISALRAHSAAAPSQGRHSSPQARIFFGQQMAGAPRPCLQPWTQIHQTQKIILIDLTPPLCSTRAFSHACGLRTCTGPVRTTSGRAPRIVEHAQAA